MLVGNVYYTPNEYEQCMIAAGWIDAGDCDSSYLAYVQRAPFVADHEVATYSQWLNMKREWDLLNAQWETDIQPYFDGKVAYPAKLNILASHLLREMSYLEVCLGY